MNDQSNKNDGDFYDLYATTKVIDKGVHEAFFGGICLIPVFERGVAAHAQRGHPGTALKKAQE